MLAGSEELDSHTTNEVGKVSLARLGVAAAHGSQIGAAQHETGRQARESLVFTAHA